MDNKYIFPSNYHIIKCDDYFKGNIINNSKNKYVLINSKTKQIYIINKYIKNFLLQFRETRGIEDLKKEGLTTISFLFEMIKHSFLINENKIKLNKFEQNNHILQIAYNKKNTKIKIINSSSNAIVLLVEKSNGNKCIYKYLQNNATNYKSIRFDQEFYIMKLAGLHPCLCKLKKYDKKNKIAKLEYAEGYTLKKNIENNLLNIQDKTKVAYEILKVCSYLHSKNIIHGDIHANQIIVNSQKDIKLIDFGFSYQINRLHHMKTLYITRGGINHYIEPENILANVFTKYLKYTPSFKCEVYRIGVLLYYLFYNQYPFDGLTWKELCRNILNKRIVFSDTNSNGEKIPTTYIEIIKKCLSRSPKLRFVSAVEIFSIVNYCNKQKSY